MVFSSLLAILELIGEFTVRLVPAFAIDNRGTLRILGLFVVFVSIALFGFVAASIADHVKEREKEKRRKAFRIFKGEE